MLDQRQRHRAASASCCTRAGSSSAALSLEGLHRRDRRALRRAARAAARSAASYSAPAAAASCCCSSGRRTSRRPRARLDGLIHVPVRASSRPAARSSSTTGCRLARSPGSDELPEPAAFAVREGPDLRRRPPRIVDRRSCGASRGGPDPRASRPRPARTGRGRTPSSPASVRAGSSLAAAGVGGILANQSFPGRPDHQSNLAIQGAVIGQPGATASSGCSSSAAAAPTRRSSAPADGRVSTTGTGRLEPSSQAYATAKIAGMQLCQAVDRRTGASSSRSSPARWRFPPTTSTRKARTSSRPCCAASTEARPDRPVEVWGSGRPLREFLHVDDLAAACCDLIELPSARLRAALDWPALVHNVGSGREVSIADLRPAGPAHGRPPRPDQPSTRPARDGAPRKLLDSGRIASLGWQRRVTLEAGLGQTTAGTAPGRRWRRERPGRAAPLQAGRGDEDRRGRPRRAGQTGCAGNPWLTQGPLVRGGGAALGRLARGGATPSS